ncbi:hypothetical protein K502DRAFT_366518 [Neoconidiobolus thromboides FSU 785]|nr:hypothetical protein K502DRAFT_366518 [Neoconidiobolus thromboides FSU 785]
MFSNPFFLLTLFIIAAFIPRRAHAFPVPTSISDSKDMGYENKRTYYRRGYAEDCDDNYNSDYNYKNSMNRNYEYRRYYPEYLCLLVVVPDLIYTWVTGQRILDNKIGCQFNGITLYLFYVIEIALNIPLAYERLLNISEKKRKKYVYIPLIVYLLVFLILLFMCAYFYDLSPSTSRASCTLPLNKLHVLTIITYYYITSGLLIGNLVIFYCYYKLITKVNKIIQMIDLELEFTNSLGIIDIKGTDYKAGIIRIYCTLVFYFCFMLGSILATIFESSLILLFDDTMFSHLIVISNQFSHALFLCGILVNSFLLLFLHTGIKAQLDILLCHLLGK